ncbi:MAG: discoidin domain-containing protein [Myxococcales bacterium]|nr:discoidin domain-containing protein [Myxococcales bacterium]
MSNVVLRIIGTLVLLIGFGCGSETEEEGAVDVEFLNLRVEEIGSTRAVVRFETNVETTCEVEWGLAATSMNNSATDPDMELGVLSETHNVPLEDLMPATTIFWRAKATDELGDTYYSEQLSFVTGDDDGSLARTNVANKDMGTSIADRSSNFANMEDESTWGAANVIDGMMASEWSSNGDGDDAFVTLDFGQARNLSAFGFRSRKMSDGTAIIESVQLTFDDDTVLGPFETLNPDQRYTFELEPIEARTVRVDAVTTTGGNTGIKEVEFYVAE